MCVFVCELIKEGYLSGGVLTGGRFFLISSLKEENTLGNNARIKQTHTARPIKNEQLNLPVKGHKGCVRVCTHTLSTLCVSVHMAYSCCCNRHILIIFIL